MPTNITEVDQYDAQLAVPSNTPANDTIYVVGNQPQVGE